MNALQRACVTACVVLLPHAGAMPEEPQEVCEGDGPSMLQAYSKQNATIVEELAEEPSPDFDQMYKAAYQAQEDFKKANANPTQDNLDKVAKVGDASAKVIKSIKTCVETKCTQSQYMQLAQDAFAAAAVIATVAGGPIGATVFGLLSAVCGIFVTTPKVKAPLSIADIRNAVKIELKEQSETESQKATAASIDWVLRKIQEINKFYLSDEPQGLEDANNFFQPMRDYLDAHMSISVHTMQAMTFGGPKSYRAEILNSFPFTQQCNSECPGGASDRDWTDKARCFDEWYKGKAMFHNLKASLMGYKNLVQFVVILKGTTIQAREKHKEEWSKWTSLFNSLESTLNTFDVKLEHLMKLDADMHSRCNLNDELGTGGPPEYQVSDDGKIDRDGITFYDWTDITAAYGSDPESCYPEQGYKVLYHDWELDNCNKEWDLIKSQCLKSAADTGMFMGCRELWDCSSADNGTPGGKHYKICSRPKVCVEKSACRDFLESEEEGSWKV